MCVVSMIGDHYTKKIDEENWPFTKPVPNPNYPPVTSPVTYPFPSRDFEAEKKVQEMAELMKKAVEYDVKNNEPECETDEKISKLIGICKTFNVDLEAVLRKALVNALKENE